MPRTRRVTCAKQWHQAATRWRRRGRGRGHRLSRATDSPKPPTLPGRRGRSSHPYLSGGDLHPRHHDLDGHAGLAPGGHRDPRRPAALASERGHTRQVGGQASRGGQGSLEAARRHRAQAAAEVVGPAAARGPRVRRPVGELADGRIPHLGGCGARRALLTARSNSTMAPGTAPGGTVTMTGSLAPALYSCLVTVRAGASISSCMVNQHSPWSSWW